jgi:hypothetical protein
MDINPKVETFYTAQFQEAYLQYVQIEYCATHQHVSNNKVQTLPSSNPISAATTSGSWQSSFDAYDLSGDDEEYFTLNDVAVMTPG